MKKNLYFLLLTILTLLVGCNTQEQKNLHIRLNKIDLAIWTATDSQFFDYQSAMDSISVIKQCDLSRDDEGYISLLESIVLSYLDKSFNSDSLLRPALQLYDDNHYPFNYARTLYYCGVMEMRKQKSDSMAFVYFKEAEKVMNESDIVDERLHGMVANSLGHILFDHRDFDEAVIHFKTAVDYFDKVPDERQKAYTSIHLAWAYSRNTQGEEGLALLDSLNYDILPVSKLSEVYRIYSSIYSSQKQYDKSIYYTQKRQKLGYTDSSKSVQAATYYELERYFSRKGELDSAIFYGNKAIQYADSMDWNKRNYYLLLALTYNNNKDFENAYKNLHKAFIIENISSNNRNNKKILEIEAKYNYAESQRLLERAQGRWTIFSICMILLVIILALSVYIALSRQKAKEDKIKQLKMAFNIQKRNLNLIPQMIKDIDECANRNSKNEEIFQDISNVSKKFRERNRQNNYLSAKEIKKNADVPSLSDKEIIVFYLINQGFSYTDISQIMGISQDNVRAINTKISKKLKNNSTN